MVGHHKEPNVYYIQLLDKSQQGPPKVVNQHQLFNLNHSGPPSVADKSQDDDDPAVYHHFCIQKGKITSPTSINRIIIITTQGLNTKQPPLVRRQR